jgi:hypothetical protein
MVTSDFVFSFDHAEYDARRHHFRGSVRVWNLHRREILRTISIPGTVGTIDVTLMPHDPKARAFTAGMLDDKLHLIDRQNGVYSISRPLPRADGRN